MARRKPESISDFIARLNITTKLISGTMVISGNNGERVKVMTTEFDRDGGEKMIFTFFAEKDEPVETATSEDYLASVLSTLSDLRKLSDGVNVRATFEPISDKDWTETETTMVKQRDNLLKWLGTDEFDRFAEIGRRQEGL